MAIVNKIMLGADRQHNCLSSYVDQVAAGETDIWLMRCAADPDCPVMVDALDGGMRQAFRACNEVPSRGELAWLSDWCRRAGYLMRQGRMWALYAWGAGCVRELPSCHAHGGSHGLVGGSPVAR